MALQSYVAFKFLNKQDGNRYAFVPKSWVVAQRASDNIVAIAYPTEETVAEQLVKNNAEPAADWKHYVCERLYSTDDYGEVKIDVMLKNNDVQIEKSTPNNGGVNANERVNAARSPNLQKLKENKAQNKLGLVPSLHITGPTMNFNIPIGEFTCQFQVPTGLLELMNSRNPGRTTEAPAVPKYEGSTFKKQTKLKELQKNIVNNHPDDTRWTLRHQHPGPGLTELYENTKVFVDDEKLRRYTNFAGSSNTLIRTLLPLVFNEDALSTCTLTKKKIRLDAEAVQALFKYVELVASKRKWDIDENNFKTCVRKRLLEIKRCSNKFSPDKKL